MVVAPRRASAQSPEWARAKAAFDQAQAAYVAGNYDDAIANFQKAYDARQSPLFLYNIGAAYQMKGKKSSDPADFDKAIDFYKRYLSEDPDATDKADVEKTVATLEEETKVLRTPPPTPPTPPDGTGTGSGSGSGSGDGSGSGSGSENVTTAPPTPPPAPQIADAKVRGLVVIESEPQGANIYINGKDNGPLAQTPWSGSLEGEFSYLIEKRGYKSKEGRLPADPSHLTVLQVVLSEEDYLGWMEIKSNVPGANIYLDDKNVGAIGKTPFSGNFKPGKHKVWISADGYDEVEQDVDVIAGEAAEINAQLKGSPVGYLYVRGFGIESSRIYVDGKVACERGPCRTPVREGKHRVTVSRPGYKPYRTSIDVQAKTEISMRADLVKKPGRGDAVVAYIFAAGFAGGGIYLGRQANQLRDDLRAEIDAGDPPPDSADPRFKRGKYYAIGADAAYGVAGILGLAAIYYTFRDKGPSSTATIDVRSLALVPDLGPDHAGLAMELSW
ncbi:MAG TPA: PEGA domain-containing protein [Kofleriaceae bacterium]|nr:PEGA domain-containing protein [Kofleriaceae bacterium]